MKAGCPTMKLRKWSPRFLRFFSLFIYSILNVSIAFALTFTLSHAYCFFFFYYYDVLFFLSLFLPRTFILFKILKIFTRNKFKLIICHVKHAQVKRQALVDIKEDLYNSFFFFFFIRWDVKFNWTRQFVGRTTFF